MPRRISEDQTRKEMIDPQLEKAVEVCLDLLAKNPPPQHKKPAYPDYQHKH